jgi:hypothetical protein
MNDFIVIVDWIQEWTEDISRRELSAKVQSFTEVSAIKSLNNSQF